MRKKTEGGSDEEENRDHNVFVHHSFNKICVPTVCRRAERCLHITGSLSKEVCLGLSRLSSHRSSPWEKADGEALVSMTKSVVKWGGSTFMRARGGSRSSEHRPHKAYTMETGKEKKTFPCLSSRNQAHVILEVETLEHPAL